MGKKLLGLLLAAWLLLGEAQADSCPFWAEFVNVGAGDCLMIGCDGAVMMVDTGAASAWAQVEKALTNLGVKQLDVLAVTHPHPDHMGNVQKILSMWPVDSAWVSGGVSDEEQSALLNCLTDAGVVTRKLYRGDEMHLGRADITVVWPNEGEHALMNDRSLVLKVTYGGFTMLLTGDAELEAEMGMVAGNNGIPLAADLLKVGHHGLSTSTSYPFASAVGAKYAVISCDGEDGRVTAAALTVETLRKCGAERVWQTNLHGNVRLEIRDDGILRIIAE